MKGHPKINGDKVVFCGLRRKWQTRRKASVPMRSLFDKHYKKFGLWQHAKYVVKTFCNARLHVADATVAKSPKAFRNVQRELS